MQNLQAQGTYRKEEVNTYFLRGRPDFVFLILQGHPFHSQIAVSSQGTLRSLCLATASESKESADSVHAALLACPRGLRLVYLEKRSQALQGCNLTRNIQVDGAPMVHPPGGILPARLFLSHHRTPLAMP